MSLTLHLRQGCGGPAGGRFGLSCPRSLSRSPWAWARRSSQAQGPLRWAKAAPFPEPEEELYGAEAGGKMYVIGGFGANGRPAPAMVYEYDPAADRWTKKKPIPVAVHHQAQTEYNGKIYVFGGCMRPLTGPGANGWEPVDNAWEYDPGSRFMAGARADADQALRGSRGGGRRQDLRHRRRHHHGELRGDGALREPPGARGGDQPGVRSRDQHVGESQPDADHAKPCVLGGGQRQDLRDRRTSRRRARHGVQQHRRGGGIRSGAGSVGRREGPHADRAERRRLGDLQRPDLRLRRRAAERSAARHLPCVRGVRARHEPLDHSPLDARARFTATPPRSSATGSIPSAESRKGAGCRTSRGKPPRRTTCSRYRPRSARSSRQRAVGSRQ